MPTLGPTLTLLPKGFSTRPRKSVDSAVATLIEGRVRATVGGGSRSSGSFMRRQWHGGGCELFHAVARILENYRENLSFQAGSAPGNGSARAS